MMSDTMDVDTIFGRIESFSDDLITNQLLSYGAHTRPELAFFLSVVRPGDFIFDIGGHVGTFTIPIAHKIGPSGRLLAIEGSETHLAVLSRNVERLKLTHIVSAVSAVIGSPSKRYSLQVREGNTGASFFTTAEGSSSRPGILLDDLLRAHFVPRVVKLVIQGHEVVALRGGRALLAAEPILYVQVVEEQLQRNASSTEELDQLLRGAGYRLFRNVGDRNGAHDNFVVAELSFLSDGGAFFDVLAIHRDDPRLETLLALVPRK